MRTSRSPTSISTAGVDPLGLTPSTVPPRARRSAGPLRPAFHLVTEPLERHEVAGPQRGPGHERGQPGGGTTRRRLAEGDPGARRGRRDLDRHQRDAGRTEADLEHEPTRPIALAHA